MSQGLKVERPFHVRRAGHGRKKLRSGETLRSPPTGRVPRISRLMALAIRFEQLLRDGEVADQAELARLGHVSRARLTQIMNLLNLASDIQEEILFLPKTERERLRSRNGTCGRLQPWRGGESSGGCGQQSCHACRSFAGAPGCPSLRL